MNSRQITPEQTDRSAPTPAEFWQRYRIVWHIVAAVNVIVVAIVLLASDRVDHTGQRIGLAVLPSNRVDPAGQRVGLVVLFALAVWYALVGAGSLDRPDSRRSLVYLVGALVGFGCLLAVTPDAGLLLFTLNPQLFAMITRWRWRVPLLLVLYGQIAVATLWHGGLTPTTVANAVVWSLAPLAGVLFIGSIVTGVVRESDQRAQLIADLVQTRADLAHERHEAGIAAERKRVAAEVHDTIAQGCTSILMLTQAARTAWREAGPDARRYLDLIEHTARDNLAEARALVAALRPPDLAERSLADALTRLADRHTRDTGVPVRVTVSGATASPVPDTDLVLLRAAQESLANIRKHAQAQSVRIALSRADGTATIEVSDDGRGFDLADVGDGYGLPGLRERADAFGGTCVVRSSPGAGTTIRVTLPEPRPTGSGSEASRPATTGLGAPAPRLRGAETCAHRNESAGSP